MTYSIVTDVNAGNSLAVLNQLVESIMRVESAIGKASAKPLRVTADKPNLANFFAACDQAEKKVIKVKSQIEAPSTIGGGFTSFLNSEKGKFANVGKEMGQSLQMGMTQQFGMAGSAMGSLASAMGPVGIGIAALSAATIGLGAASVGTAAQFQQAMANVASVTGGGIAAQKALSDAAREAGASSVFSASQSADAMYYLASAGYDTNQVISALKPTMTMAAAGGMDLARASELTTTGLAVFGKAAEDASTYTNLLAASAAAANTNVSQIGDAMGVVGGTAHTMGKSMEETAATLDVMANGGIKGAEAGHKLNAILGVLTKTASSTATKEQQNALAAMGMTADQVNPSLHSMSEIFGTLQEKGMDSAQALQIFGLENNSAASYLAANSAEIDKMQKKISGTNKAISMAATQNQTYEGSMKMLSSAVEEAEISLGSLLLGPLTSGVMLFTNLTNAAIATGKAIYDTAGAFNSWVSSSDTVKKGAELEKEYEEANKGHYEMMAGDSVWVPDQVAPTVAKVLSQSEKFTEAQSIASSMGTQSGTSYADALGNALDTKLPSTFTDAYLGPAAAALKDASTKAGTTAGEDFATGQANYIKNWQAGGALDPKTGKTVLYGNTGSGFQGNLPANGDGSSGQIATLMDNYSYQLFKKTKEGAKDVYKVYDKTGQEISGNFINVAEIERQFQDTIIDLPKFFDKRSDEISNILADATSDGIITGGEDGERQMLEDLLAQTQAAKLIVPIGFDTTKLDSQIDDLEKTLSGMKIGIDISKESFALTAAQYEYENTDLYKKMYGEGIIATDTSEDSYFRLMDDLSGSTKEGDVKTVAALKDLDKRISSGDREQLGIAKADAVLALKTHPEIIKQTGFQQRMVLAGITLNEGFRLIGDEVVPISDASVEIQDNTKDTAVYAQGIFELLAAGGFRGVVNNVNYYGTTGEAESITPWSDLKTPTTWGTSKIGAAMPSSRDLANALAGAGAKYQSGGVVGNTGIAHVEEGEVIVPADQLAQSASLASWGKQSIVSQGSGTVSDRATSAQWSDCVSGSCRLQTESTKQNIDDWNSGIRSSAKDWSSALVQSSGNVKTYSIDDWDLIYPNSETCISFNEPDPSLKFTANVKKINFDSGAWKMIYPDSETCISYNSPDPSLNFTPATNGVSSAFRGLDKTTGKTTDSLGYLLDAVDVLADGIFETSDALKNFPTGGPTPWSVIDKQISVGATGKPLVVGLSKEGYVVSYDPRTDTCDGLSFNQPDPSLVTTDPFYLGMTKNNPIMGDYESGNGWQNVAQAPKGSQLEADQKSVLSTLKQQQQEAQQSNQQLAKIGETSYAASKAALSSQNSNKLTASNTATMKPLADSTEKGTWETADNTAALINQGNAMMQGYIIQGGKLVLGGGGYSTTGKYANGSSDGGFGGTSVSGGGGWVNANPSSDWGTSGGAFSNGSGGPGWMQAATPGFQWAEGGIVDHATLGVFGESGREAFVPISDRSAGLRILPQVMRELGVSRVAAMGVGNAKSYPGGYRAVTVNVYPSPGMNESQLTKKIIKEIAYFANGGGQ